MLKIIKILYDVETATIVVFVFINIKKYIVQASKM